MGRGWRRHITTGKTDHTLSPDEIAKALNDLEQTGEIQGPDVRGVNKIIKAKFAGNDVKDNEKKPGGREK